MDVGWLDRFKKKFSSFSYREPLSSGFWAGIKVGFICLLFMFFVWISLIYLPVYVPEVYNFFWGEQVRQAHLAEVVGDENNATVVAKSLMSWIENSTTTMYNRKPYGFNIFGFTVSFSGFYWSIMDVRGNPVLFIKTNKASWLIHSRLGNCGEKSWYFTEMMEEAGFRARSISAVGEDHGWAEFYDNKGNKFVVNPANNEFIGDTYSYAKDYWSYVRATSLNRSEYDLTSEYIQDISCLSVKASGEIPFAGLKATVYSKSLKERNNRYKTPFEIKSLELDTTGYSRICLRSKDDYLLEERLDLTFISFHRTQNLSLLQNKKVTIEPESLLDLNFDLNLLYIIPVLVGVGLGIVLLKVLNLSSKFYSLIKID
ncbi:MAG: transglutaminase domain-containing protein [Candidatus Hodarchaeales archaeon]